MPRRSPAVHRPWQVTFILTFFGVAVTAAAATGWWYARESTPAQGPIVLVSIDGLQPDELVAYGASGSRAPAVDALAADAVLFERAYTHSPLTLPAHASLLAGQLPFEHGVRDEAGFALKDDVRSLAELLGGRGFETGAAVSSFLLRPESGVAQGFSFFDAELSPTPGSQASPVVSRDGERTVEAAEGWLRNRRGQRFFLFVQVDEASADAAVARLVGHLKDAGLYDQAAVVVTSDRGNAGAGVSLDETALHVPLLVKQPESRGAGRRVLAPVQHIDLMPTVLDLVRAPIPAGLRGRSLRPVLDGDERRFRDQPIYAETLAPVFRFGGRGKFSLLTPAYRYVRVGDDEMVEPEDGLVPPGGLPESPHAVELRTELNRLLEGKPVTPPAAIPPAEEDQFAALGYLAAVPLFDAEPEPLDPEDEAWVVRTQQAAAVLVGSRHYSAAIEQLDLIARAHPQLAVVQYQLGTLLGRMGRLEEARRAFAAAAALEPDNPYIASAVAGLLVRADEAEAASHYSALAVALADHRDSRARAAARQSAARVALALGDVDQARAHADAAEQEDAAVPIRRFVDGRILFAEGRYEEALAAFEEAVAGVSPRGRPLEDLELGLALTLERLDRHEEAQEHLRAELRMFPRNVQAHAALAAHHHAGGRLADAEDAVRALIEDVPTPEAYDAAANLWTAFGDTARAAALRAEGRLLSRGASHAALPRGAAR